MAKIQSAESPYDETTPWPISIYSASPAVQKQLPFFSDNSLPILFYLFI